MTTSRPTLAVDPGFARNGKTVVFSGTLNGPFYGGRPNVALQVRVGKKWRTFKAVPVSQSGIFGGSYRFTGTSRRTVYRFRAKPLVEGSYYPFSASPSRKAQVLVLP